MTVTRIKGLAREAGPSTGDGLAGKLTRIFQRFCNHPCQPNLGGEDHWVLSEGSPIRFEQGRSTRILPLLAFWDLQSPLIQE
jgi:hypothetical protein